MIPSEFKKRLSSFKYAGRGIQEMFRNHANFKLQLFFACLAFIFGLIFKISQVEWITLLLCIGGVLSLETINSSIEYLVDLVSPDFHPTAGKIKDLAAAAVLIFSFVSLIIGFVIFIPYFF
jgi:diacylglycerol kinase